MPRRAVAVVPPVPELLYKTTNLNFAAYLIAAGRLVFAHAMAHARHSEFYFRDPQNIGPQLLAEYLTKDVQVGARLLLEARSTLLNEIRGSQSRG